MFAFALVAVDVLTHVSPTDGHRSDASSVRGTKDKQVRIHESLGIVSFTITGQLNYIALLPPFSQCKAKSASATKC